LCDIEKILILNSFPKMCGLGSVVCWKLC